MDFSQVKSVEIQEGAVRGIFALEGTVLRWKRPLTYPVIGLLRKYEFTSSSGVRYIRYACSDMLIDKNGMTCKWSDKIPQDDRVIENSDGSITTFNFSEFTTIGSAEAISVGDILMAHRFNNESQIKNFSLNTGTLADAEWIFSDEATGKIKLYARPAQTSSMWQAGSWRWNTSWDEYDISLREHNTDVIVNAGQPLITLSSKTGSTVQVTGIRTNVDDYKTKYNNATAGVYPKSEYPYLVIGVSLKIKSPALSIQTSDNVTSWDMLYIIMEVER